MIGACKEDVVKKSYSTHYELVYYLELIKETQI